MNKLGFTVWITGLSGSGKTTVAGLLAEKLEAMGQKTQILDGASIRKTISQGVAFLPEERDRNTRIIGEVCQILVINGMAAVVAAESPFEESRILNRSEILRYIEIYLQCPLEVLEARDSEGFYAKARRGEFSSVPGVTSPYEEPSRPEVVCNTDAEPPEQCVKKIIRTLQMLKYLPGRADASTYSKEEEEMIEQHLKGLGYK